MIGWSRWLAILSIRVFLQYPVNCVDLDTLSCQVQALGSYPGRSVLLQPRQPQLPRRLHLQTLRDPEISRRTETTPTASAYAKKTKQPPHQHAEPHPELDPRNKLGRQRTKRRSGNKPPMQIPQRQVPAHGREPEDLPVQRLAPRRHLSEREVPVAVARVEHGGDVVEGGLDRRRRRRLRAEEGDEIDGDVEVLSGVS